jgi:hypothetical protein
MRQRSHLNDYNRALSPEKDRRKTMTDRTTQPASTRAKVSRPAKSESTRISASQRNTFRMMLATGATVAALVGAQAMAILDRSSATTPVQSTSASTKSTISNVGASPTSAIDYNSTNPTPASAISYSSAVQSSVTQPRPVTKSS